MNPILSEYLEKSTGLLRQIAEFEEQNLERAAEIIAEAYAAGHRIYVFGCTHSAILAEDVFYRAGAPAFWRPLWGPGMSIATTPGFLTSAAEHNAALGRAVIECSQLKKGDVLVIASTSGKNGAPVAVAERALERGAELILLTSGNYKDQHGDHPRIANLWSLRDRALVIDNHVPVGDAAVALDDACRMGPLSTIAGSFIMHSLSALAIRRLMDKGIDAPVFMSSNAPGGREKNEKLMNLQWVRDAFLLP